MTSSGDGGPGGSVVDAVAEVVEDAEASVVVDVRAVVVGEEVVLSGVVTENCTAQ